MKSKSKKRILALVLSMVLMLSTGISAMAEGEAANGKTDGTTAEKTEPAAENQEVQEGSGETPDGEKPEELQEVAEAQTQTDGSQESGTEEIISEAADLYQDFQDENGNVITTIHAYVPEGAFQAKADQITMQAKLLDQESDDYIKGMIEEKLPENSYLGGYVLYEVNFMVDGVITEPAKAITLTIEGSGLSVTDLSRTKAFRYDPADPDVDGDKDELVEMGQKANVLTYLAENGIGEDQLSTYEYSELDVQKEIAHQIGFNTWKSTIYGCYTEAYSAEYTFSQEVNGAAVNVTAPEGAFPTAVENVSFAAAAVTEEQDALIQDQLAAKAEGLGQEVKGYQAYDLSFTVNGEEVQPQVPVTVSFENTGLSTEEANGTQNFQLDEEAGAVNDLEGSADNGTAAMTLSQMGTVGYWAYGDAAADEDGSKDDADVDDTVVPGDETETPTETPTDTPDDPEQDQTDVEIEDDTEEDSNLTDDSEDQIQEDGEEDKTEEGDLEDDADEADETDKEDVTEKEDAELAEDAETEKDTTASGEETEEDSSKEESKETEEDIEDTEEDQEEKEDDSQDGKGQDVEEEDGQEDDSKDKDTDTLTLKEEAEEKDTAKENAQEKEEVKELTYEDDSVVVTVSAEKDGVIPKGAELSVTPIEKTEITKDMSAEEKAEAEKMNEQYAFTEEKLQEESEAKDETMEGFLAYDICFLVDGEEVEPSGEVQVVLDFKEAAIPEGVSEDTAITVKHLREDETAQDGVVVEDMTEKSEVQITDNSKVEKVELRTDSFSIYTLSWGNGRNLSITVVDTNGREIGTKQTRTLESNSATVEEIAAEFATPSGYEFKEARVGSRWTGATKIKELRYYNNANQYRTINLSSNGAASFSNWTNVDRKTVYFVYSMLPGTISTADTSDIIQLNLFDYVLDSDGNQTYNETNDTDNGYRGDDTGIDEGHAFKFQSYGGGRSENSINKSGGNSTNPNIVESKLVDGFPKLNPYKRDSDGKSLAYLFDTTPIDGVKSVHTGLTNLFIYNQGTGYYSYDSNENYAYLNLEENPDNKNFTVYNTTANDGDDNHSQFFPFTKYSVANGAARGPKTGVDLDCNSEQNHYFGMTMETTFVQPRGGMINGRDMIFSFSGDDDVWVYIDGVLVLDIGGSHSAINGTINFNTGEVTVNGTTKSLAGILRAGGVSEDKLSGNTLKNYRDFTMNFFYLERGNYDSNCKLEFNLASIPSQSVMVTKDVTNESGESVDYTSNIEFLFEISYEGQVYRKQDYQIWKDGQNTGKTGTTNDQGEFVLKNGESAVFPELNVQSGYEVKEKGAYLNGYKVTIDGTTVTDAQGTAISSGTQLVGDVPVLVFHNQIDNTATLSIEKQLESGVSDPNKDFTMKVHIDGEEYQGTYSIYQGTTKIKDGKTDNGQIVLKADQHIEITGLPYGVKFEVEEVLDGSYLPTYTVSGSVYNILLPNENDESNEVNSASGNMAGNAKVTVTNKKVVVDSGTTELTVTKTWENGTDDIRPNAIQVTLYQDNNNNGIKDEGDAKVEIQGTTNPITLNADKHWTHTWYNLPADTNFVVEEAEINDGELDDFTASYNLISDFEFEEQGRITTCSNITYNIGQNNMLLVKLTQNAGYILWTPVDLGLTEQEVKDIAAELKTKGLSGSGNLNLDNLVYVYGDTNQYMTGVTLKKLDTGWQLKFEAKSAWSMFWHLQYDRTIEAGITNNLNTDKTINIPVKKVWKGDQNQYDFEDVTVQLYKNGSSEGAPVKIRRSDNWEYTFENLPYYGKDGDKYIVNEYSIEETHVGSLSMNDIDWIFVDISWNANDGFIITNNVPKKWVITKVSSTNNDLILEGAEFTLTLQEDSNQKYYGRSYGDGTVGWWDNQEEIGNLETELKFIPDGTYLLEETKAPVGYQKSTVTWTIEIKDLQVTKITDNNGDEVEKEPSKTRALVEVDEYRYENTPLYELPSAGGPGIFLYMIGGTLLLIAGSLMIYINRRKGVLEK